MKLTKIIQHKKNSVYCKVYPRKWLYKEGFIFYIHYFSSLNT